VIKCQDRWDPFWGPACPGKVSFEMQEMILIFSGINRYKDKWNLQYRVDSIQILLRSITFVKHQNLLMARRENLDDWD